MTERKMRSEQEAGPLIGNIFRRRGRQTLKLAESRGWSLVVPEELSGWEKWGELPTVCSCDQWIPAGIRLVLLGSKE